MQEDTDLDTLSIISREINRIREKQVELTLADVKRLDTLQKLKSHLLEARPPVEDDDPTVKDKDILDFLRAHKKLLKDKDVKSGKKKTRPNSKKSY